MIISAEDKMLLLQDLCGRIPYDTFIKIGNNPNPFPISTRMRWILNYGSEGTIEEVFINGNEICRPFLRPMSSMTEEEYKEYDKATDLDVADSGETLKANLNAKARVRISKWYHGNDWLNAHHFDYRGLIEKGLAIVAPSDMYKSYSSDVSAKNTVSLESVAKDLIDIFKIKNVSEHKAGESFYLTHDDGTVILMFDKSDKNIEQVRSVVNNYMKDKVIDGGQCRVSPMTLVWTSVYIEPYIGFGK